MKKIYRVASIACAFALSIALAGCAGAGAGTSGSSEAEDAGATLTLYTQAPINGGNGIIVSAQNSTSSDVTVTKDALTVSTGESISIQPKLESGSIHVTITPSDAQEAIFDADVEGTKEVSVEAGKGSYDVATTPNEATGELTVVPQSAK